LNILSFKHRILLFLVTATFLLLVSAFSIYCLFPIKTSGWFPKTAFAQAMLPGNEMLIPSTIEMILIPGGTFKMGTDNIGSGEKPVHTVTLSGFRISKSEITVSQYRACVDAGACSQPDTGYYCNWGKKDRGDHPINCVNWNQSQAFCKWAGGRLPTEAEWEYAARSDDERKYPWGNQEASCKFAVMCDGVTKENKSTIFSGCGRDGTWSVCSKPAGNSKSGLCDMAGNVWEWVSDWYGDYPSTPQKNPKGPVKGELKVLRGGSWNSMPKNCQSAVRNGYLPDIQNYDAGFRLVMPFVVAK